MANWLKWIEDRKKNVSNVVHDVTDAASRAIDQVNTLDNNRTWKQRTPTNSNSVAQQATHNGITNTIGDFVVKPATHLGLAVNQGFANAERKIAGLPTQNADQFMKSSFPSLPKVNDTIGYTGTKRQLAGDTITTAANVIAPGSSKIAEGIVAKAAPKIVPKLAQKVVAESATGAILGGPQNVGTVVADDKQPLTADNIKEAYKEGTIGGAAFGAAAPLAPVAAKVAGKVAQSGLERLQAIPRDIRKTAAATAANNAPVQNVPINSLEKTDMQGYGDLDPKQVERYKTRILNQQPIEPMVVVRDDSGKLFVEDGKHRRQAYADFGAKEAPARIISPQQLSAITEGGYAAIPGRGDEALGSVPKVPATPEIAPDVQMPVAKEIDQQISPPNNTTPAVQHSVEDAAANRAAIRSSELDRVIQQDMGQPGATLQSLVDAHMERTGQDKKAALQDVWRVGQQSGYDLRDGYPTKVQPDQTPLTSLRSGVQTTAQQLASIRKATAELKLKQTKGLTGVEHAVVIKQSPYQQQYLYMDNNGRLSTFISQKDPNGKWQQIVNSRAPVKSARDGGQLVKLMSDPDMQAEALRANQDGMTRQYIWQETEAGPSSLRTKGKKDPVTPDMMAFDPQKHTIEGGFVRDRESGAILGNYVSVGPDGIKVQVGRQFINLGIDPSKLNEGGGGLLSMVKSEGGNNRFNQTERWIDAVTKDPQTRDQLRNIVVHPAREAEARLKIEANALGNGIKSWRKAFNGAARLGDAKAAARDAVYYLEPDQRAVRQMGVAGAKQEALKAFTDAHGPQAAQVLVEYAKWMRGAYDNLLERMNTTRRQFGLDEVPRRADYITHIQELNKGVGQLYQNMREGIMGDAEGTPTRGKLPAQISGLSGEFKPVQKYNPFAKQRTGDLKPSNPFDPLATYAGVALHNIHLTKPAALVRSLETALRSADTFVQSKPKGLTGAAAEEWDKLISRYAGNYGDATKWLAQHANILAGKSSESNRLLLDSEGGRQALRTLNFLQRQAGQANILGNASSVVAQTLNFPSTLGTNGLRATFTGVARSLGGAKENAAWRASNFMKERYTDGSVLRDKAVLEKILRPFGVPLGVAEKAFVHIAWNSSYERALAKGLKGDAAIRAADTATSKIVAGRSIGDTPHIYNSTVGSTALQFTRETTEQWKNFTKDQNTYGKALTLMGVFLMNNAVQHVTGRSPMADPLGSTIQTVMDVSGANDSQYDDNTAQAKLGRALQRGATTLVSGVPVLSAISNELPQNTRKTLFGSESDLGRYDSGPAVVSLPANLVSAGKKAASGDLTGAGQDIVRNLPVGGQARKTWQGVQAMNDSSPEDRASALKWAQAALFGKNAIQPSGAGAANGNGGNASPSVTSNGDVGKTLRANIQERKQQDVQLSKQLSSEENDLRKLSSSDRQQLVDQGVVSQDELDSLDQKVLGIKKELGISAGTSGQSIPANAKNAPQNIRDFYERRSYVSDKDKKTWLNATPDKTDQSLVSSVNSIKPSNMPDVPNTNEVAQLYADFVRKRAANSWSKMQENEEKGKLLKNAYKTQLDGDAKFVFGLSASKLIDGVESGTISKNLLDKVMAVDDTLVQMGFTADIPKSVRSKYGYATYSSSSGGRSSSGDGRRKAVNTSLLTTATKLPSIGSLGSYKVSAKSPKQPTFKAAKLPKIKAPKVSTKNIDKLLKKRAVKA